jgi:CubicO group peptidase (beta-lactamase class C family)
MVGAVSDAVTDRYRAAMDRAAGSEFSGVVHVALDGRTLVAQAFGLADRRHGIAMRIDSQLAMASGSKGLTALAVMSLVADGALDLATPARAVLGADLPLIGDEVTVEHLLSHRSGIGDYLDEDAGFEISDYVMPVPVHELATSQDYVTVLAGHPVRFPAGERFAYCNSGFVVLALIAERVSGVPFHQLVIDRVCEPADMPDTAYFRSDELPGRAAVGYLSSDPVSRTNVLHLPVRGSGDGGAYTTAADVRTLWTSLFAGRIVPLDLVAEMVRPRTEELAHGKRYGLGFWLHPTGRTVILEGYDAGVSFRSWHDPQTGLTHTVISNTSDGAWPIVDALEKAAPALTPE